MIAVAPNGARLMKSDHANLPLGPVELAWTAAECLGRGASMIHVHVRDGEGRHLLDADAYRAATQAIHDQCGDDLVIQVTTEAVGLYTPAEQRALVRDLRPEAASLALRELVPNADHEREFADLLSFMGQENIAPQLILYSAEDAMRLSDLKKRGLIPFETTPVLFVLGRYATDKTAHPVELAGIPQSVMDGDWMLCAFGAHEARCGVAAALLGGGVRIGFENNTLMPDGTVAPGNGALVEAVTAPLRQLGIRPATADEVRQSWSL